MITAAAAICNSIKGLQGVPLLKGFHTQDFMAPTTVQTMSILASAEALLRWSTLSPHGDADHIKCASPSARQPTPGHRPVTIS